MLIYTKLYSYLTKTKSNEKRYIYKYRLQSLFGEENPRDFYSAGKQKIKGNENPLAKKEKKMADTLSGHYGNKTKRKGAYSSPLSVFWGKKEKEKKEEEMFVLLLMTEWGRSDTRQPSHKGRTDKAKTFSRFRFFLNRARRGGIRTFFQYIKRTFFFFFIHT